MHGRALARSAQRPTANPNTSRAHPTRSKRRGRSPVTTTRGIGNANVSIALVGHLFCGICDSHPMAWLIRVPTSLSSTSKEGRPLAW